MQEHPLRAYRRKKKLSLEQLALAAVSTKATLSRIEAGLQTPSFGLVGRIVAATEGEITADMLLAAQADTSTDHAAD